MYPHVMSPFCQTHIFIPSGSSAGHEIGSSIRCAADKLAHQAEHEGDKLRMTFLETCDQIANMGIKAADLHSKHCSEAILKAVNQFNANNTQIVSTMVKDCQSSMTTFTQMMNANANRLGDIMGDFNNIVKEEAHKVSNAIKLISVSLSAIALAVALPDRVKEAHWYNMHHQFYSACFSPYDLVTFVVVGLLALFVADTLRQFVISFHMMKTNQTLFHVRLGIQEAFRRELDNELISIKKELNTAMNNELISIKMKLEITESKVKGLEGNVHETSRAVSKAVRKNEITSGPPYKLFEKELDRHQGAPPECKTQQQIEKKLDKQRPPECKTQ